MPSVWISRRTAADDSPRFRVEYRVGGRESRISYGGSFKTKRDADERRRWIVGELAGRRVPDLRSLEIASPGALMVSDAIERWRASRVDVAEGTRVLHRVALNRVSPILGKHRVDELTVDDINDLVVQLSAKGKKRETIRKSIKYLAAVLEANEIEPNPARSKQIRLPHEEPAEIEPPTSAHVETVCRLLPTAYRLPLLWLDWSGARLASIETVLVGDYDEQARRIRLRASTTKTRRALWVELPDVLADAIEAKLPPREDRDPAALLFPVSAPPDYVRR